MKKHNLLYIVTLIFSSLVISCSGDVEPIDPAIQIPNPNNGGGNNGGGDNGGGTSTGDYWPMAVNNSWTFIKDGENQPPMKIISTESINNSTHYKYENFVGMSTEGQAFEGTIWTKKSNGNYYVRQQATIPGIPGMPSITISPIEIIILKDFLAVNQTWTQNFTQTTTIEGIPPVQTQVNIVGKILEKDVTVTVNNVSYENVIKVELIQNTQGQTLTNYYWFAKNIGLIKYINIAMGQTLNHDLVNYTVN